ncbi:uncharacterized protein LOC108652738 [Drosophila navojoa]|uniref:uncharacterized protein LOC108652738 n=1 Tax=Drosophila navojoa TaxID=7232 RepID=UPI0011BDB401|nr:uncharacterized protein LOC108652738 [Drosophila navojoa]
MWTYMMAAARGDRVNTMMSSRRRPETESPKYGYNLSRPMYRTTRFVSPVASAPAQLGPSSCNPAHEELEVSGGLYAPFQPTLGAVGAEGGVCLPRKHLIANQTAMPLPMGPTDGAEPDEQQPHYPRSSCSNNSSWLSTPHTNNTSNNNNNNNNKSFVLWLRLPLRLRLPGGAGNEGLESLETFAG